MGQETITLKEEEMKKVLVVEKVIHHYLTVREAAELLEISPRQVLRLKKRYLKEGPQGMAHKNRGRKPVHAISDTVKEQVAELYRKTYHGCNNTHYAELLEERETIKLSTSTVRRILLEKGLKQNNQRRRKKAHQPRDRKAQAGMLWQIDASPHAWLEDRGPNLTLHGAIDDATGQVVGAVFRLTETQEGYFTVMRQAIEAYGIPMGIYTDRHTIFRSPKEKLSLEQELAGETQPLSQFGKAMAELNITHIKAQTPEAKGRIERLWGTFQDRLIIELRLLGVSTLEEANRVLPELIAKHNAKFAVKPKEDSSAYRPVKEGLDLRYVLAVREMRQMGPGQTISYGNRLYTVADKDSPTIEPKTLVEVRQATTGEVVLFYQGRVIPLRQTEKPQRQSPPKTKKTGSAQPRKPAEGHPWKTSRKRPNQNQLQRSINTISFEDKMYSQHNSYAKALW